MSADKTFEAVVANGGGRRDPWVPVAVVVIVGAALAMATFVGVGLLKGIGEDVAAGEEITRAIQDERARSIRRNCEELNGRHAKIVKAADDLLAEQRAGPEQRAEVRKFTTALADAAAPIRDCDRLVRRAVRERRSEE